MPYQTPRGTFQTARRLGHVPIVESEFVKARLKDYRIFGSETIEDVADHLLTSTANLPDPGPPMNWALSFDGSTQEVAIREQYPSTRIGYLQIAGVAVNLNAMLDQGKNVFVNPTAIRDAARASLYSVVLPGSNTCHKQLDNVRDSWRREMFTLFGEYEIEGQSILDFYIDLLRFGDRTTASGDSVILSRCSAGNHCSAQDIPVPRSGARCPTCGGDLYPTDSLRIHEEVQESNPNATALGRLMTVLEHITMLCYLDFLRKRQPRLLSSVAFIYDGPLALFGPQAPLKRAILAYLQSVSRELKTGNYRPPLMVGIEKTGQFAEHAAQLSDHLKPGTLMRIPDDYIFKRILTTRPTSAFGEDTYYGRKFFYKSASGQMLTITVPCLDDAFLSGGKPDDPAGYETLAPTLALLDKIGTRLYQNAVIPVALAHSYAAVPLRTGSKVLTLMAQDILGNNESQNQ